MPIKTSSPKDLRSDKTSFGQKLRSLNTLLTTIFLIIWIAIGLFASVLIISGYRQGLFAGFFNPRPQASVDKPPTETQLPGIGKINIACTEAALSPQAIQKLVQNGLSSLTAEEKTKFEKCIIEKEATPQPTPTP